MPFWSKNKDKTTNGDSQQNGEKKVDYKARLQHKQYLAQESPEPVYDISECGLKAVPSGVYSKCKVLRKEALLLHNNELTTLVGGGISLVDMSEVLQVLDLHSNCLEKLPDEIGKLKQLRVLFLHQNKLKKLPATLGDLHKLQNLNVSSNKLTELPPSISQLPRLKTLDLKSNAKLTKLTAKTLAPIRSLENLCLDADSMAYPPCDVAKAGTEAMMKLFCKDCDMEYISPSEYEPPALANGNGSSSSRNGSMDEDPYEKLVNSNLQKMEKIKADKIKEMQAMEKEREETAKKEAALAASLSDHKKKLLDEMAANEAMRDEQVKKVQDLKDKEKEMLFGSLADAENGTDILITELMKANARVSDPAKVLEELEREKREMEDRFTIKAGEAEKLREQEVLKEMQRMMEEQMKREQILRKYEDGKRDIISNAVSLGLENDKAVDSILTNKGRQQQELISNLLEDEKYQREAFRSLLVTQDTRHKEITNQVEQIQNELASLTMVEMTKKDLKMEFERDVMEEKRETLTKMLLQLMEQKEDRAKELQERIREMENLRNQETENYWLIQYQKLLDSKPKNMVEAEKRIDPALLDLLKSVGAEDYVPIFSLRDVDLKRLSYMNDRELQEMGIQNTYIRQKILVAAQSALDSIGNGTAGGAPTAPPPSSTASAPPSEEIAAAKKLDQQPETPSAPPAAATTGAVGVVDTYQSTECVICLENKCNIIFLPCGHVCVCFNCQAEVSLCPLCRKEIAQKVRLG